MKKNISLQKFKKLKPLQGKDYNGLEATLDAIGKEDMCIDSLDALSFLCRHKDPFVRQSVIEIVRNKIKNAKTFKKELFRLLLIGIGDEYCRYEALKGFTPSQQKNTVFLLGGILLQDKNPIVRIQASEILASLDNSDGIPFLEQSLSDKDYLVRNYSAYGLALLNSKESISKLIKLQKKDRKMLVKVACWGALLLLTKQRKWFYKLLKVMNHTDYHVPMHAINYIENAIKEGIIHDSDAIPHIKQSLSDEKRKAVSSRIINFLKRRIPTKRRSREKN